MASSKYLSKENLNSLWDQINSIFVRKSDVESQINNLGRISWFEWSATDAITLTPGTPATLTDVFEGDEKWVSLGLTVTAGDSSEYRTSNTISQMITNMYGETNEELHTVTAVDSLGSIPTYVSFKLEVNPSQNYIQINNLDNADIKIVAAQLHRLMLYS